MNTGAAFYRQPHIVPLNNLGASAPIPDLTADGQDQAIRGGDTHTVEGLRQLLVKAPHRRRILPLGQQFAKQVRIVGQQRPPGLRFSAAQRA